jgi:transposase
MSEVSIIGLDLAKNLFQVHGAAADGSVVFRKKLSRGRLLDFFAGRERSFVAMEACASSHYWARQISALGHEVRLIPPVYVKPFVKRQKNDAADAEAIAEAASRANMRFVSVKSEEKQALGMVFRTRDLYVRQRTQTINVLRGLLAEFGIVAPQGTAHVERLAHQLEQQAGQLPPDVVVLGRDLLGQITGLKVKIAALDARLRALAPKEEAAKRLMDVPGVGPICAAAVQAFAPPMETFRKGRDFSAWLGLVPRQHSSGGKERLGKVSKMGQRDLRRLLIIGATAVVRWAARRSVPGGSWLARMLPRKPRKLVAVALANKMARTIWALMSSGDSYRNPAPAR